MGTRMRCRLWLGRGTVSAGLPAVAVAPAVLAAGVKEGGDHHGRTDGTH